MPQTLKNSICCFSASDSSGHSGLQADLRTLQGLDVHGCAVITAITAQNSLVFTQLKPTDDDILTAQWQSIQSDIKPKICKIGLLAQPQQIKHMTNFASQYPACWIADPVLSASTGFTLHKQQSISAYLGLLPHLDLLTPNIPEVEQLLGIGIRDAQDIVQAAQQFLDFGVTAVLIKGGHQYSETSRCEDYFCSPTHQFWLSHQKHPYQHTRGTGCVMASAIAAFIAHGKAMQEAVILAHAYVQQGLRHACAVGQGPGPIYNGSWPTELMDYPEVSDHPHYQPPEPFASCNTKRLGLYPVIDNLDWLKKLLREGITTIQLRIKNLAGDELEQTLRRAIFLAQQCKARLFINDHWRLAIKLNAYGVHLGQEDITTANIQAIRQAGLRLGVSTHSEYEWGRARGLRPSYIALGAVFPTQTKKAQVIGINNLLKWAPLLQQQYPVTAIGGINLSNIDEVLSSGTGSIAVVTAITHADDYQQATQQLLARMGDMIYVQ